MHIDVYNLAHAYITLYKIYKLPNKDPLGLSQLQQVDSPKIGESEIPPMVAKTCGKIYQLNNKKQLSPRGCRCLSLDSLHGPHFHLEFLHGARFRSSYTLYSNGNDVCI